MGDLEDVLLREDVTSFAFGTFKSALWSSLNGCLWSGCLGDKREVLSMESQGLSLVLELKFAISSGID